jgi:hypothetical protein
LNKDLTGAREALYYGLLPGLIHLKGRGLIVLAKVKIAVTSYKNAWSGKNMEGKGVRRISQITDLRFIG